MSRLGNDVKDFIAAFTAMQKNARDDRHQQMMERYYAALINNANAKGIKPAQDAYNAGFNGAIPQGSSSGGTSAGGGSGAAPAAPSAPAGGGSGAAPAAHASGGGYNPANAPAFLDDTARSHGIDPDYLKRTAWIESKFNPTAHAGSSSAGGMFQFTNDTARQYGLANKNDPRASADAAARLAHDNSLVLSRDLGRTPTNAELYLAHQQGAGSAARLLNNPNASAVSIVGHDAVVNNGGNANMTAGQFANLWLNKYNSLGGASSPAQQQRQQAIATPDGSQLASPAAPAPAQSGADFSADPAQKQKQREFDAAHGRAQAADAAPTPPEKPDDLAQTNAPDTPTPPARPNDLSQNTSSGNSQPAPAPAQPQPQQVASSDDSEDQIADDEAAIDGGEYARGGKVQAIRTFASGGPVFADDDESDDEETETPGEPDEPEGVEAQEARSPGSTMRAIDTTPTLPVGAAQGAATQGGEWKPASLPDILQSVGSWLSEKLGGFGKGAIGQPSPEAHAMLSGKDAMHPQDMATIAQMVDPHNELEHSIRMTRGLQAMYNYYAANGDLNHAQQAAASMLNGARLSAAKLGSQAAADMQHGDTSGAVDKLLAADNSIPNGRVTKAQPMQDGTYGVIQTDEHGHVTYQGRVTPDMILAAANGLANGSEFWKQMEAAAGKKYSAPSGPSQAYQAYMGGQGGGGGSPAGGVPGGAPSQPSQAIDTQGGNGASPMAMPTAEQWSQMTPHEQKAILQRNQMNQSQMQYQRQVQRDQAIDTRNANADARQARQDERQSRLDAQHDEDRQAKLNAPPKPMSVGDRGKLGEQIHAHADELGTQLPTSAPSESPGALTKPQFDKLRPHLSSVAGQFAMHNEMSPAEAMDAANRISSVNPHAPDQKPYSVKPGAKGAVALTMQDGTEYALSRQGYASLEALRAERLKVLQGEELARQNSPGAKAGAAVERIGGAVGKAVDETVHNREGLGPTNFSFEPM
ncbi:transglycosylase SLT domain-containing protein [Methylocystis heyeri]|uniref:Transglycosylase SLT domain-containing protein n=1 Tax=Methylocystis heyeri TaxID=391905 RepID=A0A6B8KET7_9HYPH|nr:transglycosylase SLT domain-containing protein [Methylocystis heyeri]QGM46132.1 transglycosylase SLT domain-containing protein [Methylocystis heyeri]